MYSQPPAWIKKVISTKWFHSAFPISAFSLCLRLYMHQTTTMLRSIKIYDLNEIQVRLILDQSMASAASNWNCINPSCYNNNPELSLCSLLLSHTVEREPWTRARLLLIDQHSYLQSTRDLWLSIWEVGDGGMEWDVEREREIGRGKEREEETDGEQYL